MKKIILYLIAAVAVLLLIGCKSDPINPKIIGTTYLQEEKGLIFADFDSVRYAPTIIYTGEKVGRDGIKATLKPITGMQVTAFTSNIHKEPVFFAGIVTVEQIENFYNKNPSFLIVGLIIIFGLLFMGACLTSIKKETIQSGIV